MKKIKLIILALGLTGILLIQQGCIGSFALTKNLYGWNTSYDKYASEAIFLAFIILPVYEVAIFVDAVVLNTIEFWTGDNPVSMNGERKPLQLVHQNGRVYELSEKNNLVNLKVCSGHKLLSTSELYLDKSDKSVYLKQGNNYIRIVEYVPAQNGTEEYAILYAKSKKIKVRLGSGSLMELKAQVDKQLNEAPDQTLGRR